MTPLPKAYVLLRIRGSRRPHRLQLPVAVGSSGLCDVVVNAASVASHAYTIRAAGRSVRVEGRAQGTDVPAQALRQLGIEVLAVLSGVPEGSSLPKRLFGEVLAREGELMQRLPQGVRTLLLGSMPQRLRIAVWSVAAVAFIGVLIGLSSKGPPLDLSRQPLVLQWDTLRTQTLGANPGSPKFQRGYEKGFLFQFEAPADGEKQASLLSFVAAGFDIGGEVVLTLNGETIFKSAAEPSCATTVCQKVLRIPSGLVKSGVNTLKATHANPRSSYFLGNLHIRSMPILTPTESAQASLWMSLAQRAYDERNIMPENLLTAERHIAATLKLANERDGAAILSARAEALRIEVNKEFISVTEKLWGDVTIAEKLEKLDDIEKTLKQLSHLYPDPSATAAILVRQKQQELKELRQQ